MEKIIEDYLIRHAEFDFDELQIVNNHPMNIRLSAKCRKYIDPDAPEEPAHLGVVNHNIVKIIYDNETTCDNLIVILRTSTRLTCSENGQVL